MNQPPQQPIVQPTVHVCLSGSPACSGCNPCPECLHLVQDRVLPAALVAAGFNGTILQALHQCLQYLRENGVAPEMIGVQVPPFAQPLEQSRVFFQGYLDGWRRLHHAMANDPTLRERIRMTDVSSLLNHSLRPASASGGPPVAASGALVGQAPAPAPVPSPPAPAPAPPVVAAPIVPVISRVAPAPPVRVMDAEEIAAAIVPTDEPPTRVVFGDVMHVPSELASHVAPPVPPSSKNGV